jgi:hypothetical protein
MAEGAGSADTLLDAGQGQEMGGITVAFLTWNSLTWQFPVWYDPRSETKLPANWLRSSLVE